MCIAKLYELGMITFFYEDEDHFELGFKFQEFWSFR
jgi:hypothetical protein